MLTHKNLNIVLQCYVATSKHLITCIVKVKVTCCYHHKPVMQWGNDQNGPGTKAAHSPGPKRPTARSKTARSYIQNGPRGCPKRPMAR